jgi:hypothetical protein
MSCKLTAEDLAEMLGAEREHGAYVVRQQRNGDLEEDADEDDEENNDSGGDGVGGGDGGESSSASRQPSPAAAPSAPSPARKRPQPRQQPATPHELKACEHLASCLGVGTKAALKALRDSHGHTEAAANKLMDWLGKGKNLSEELSDQDKGVGRWSADGDRVDGVGSGGGGGGGGGAAAEEEEEEEEPLPAGVIAAGYDGSFDLG